MVGSLPVENVQDLASKKLSKVPERYIRPELKDEPPVSEEQQQEIPVIDFHRLGNAHQFSESDSEMAKLHSACRDWGFFQLINHGVAEQVIERMKAEVVEFFKLPLEEKKAYSQLPTSNEGYGQAFVLSEDQKLDWGDMLFILIQPLSLRNYRFWPTSPSTFRETLLNHSSEMQRVAILLMGFMAKNLNVDQEIFNQIFDQGLQGVRINYYPPCPHADEVLGLSPHSDGVALTLLSQVNEIQGLQIRKNGNWVPVKPIPGAFIVNIGDIFEILSNGKYKSIEHRATINAKAERLSMATFHSPKLDAQIGPLQELVKEEGKKKYKTISYVTYSELIGSSKLQGKKVLDSVKLN